MKGNANKVPAQFGKKDMNARESYMGQGFSNWSKKDFYFYIRQCETFGRKEYESISQAFGTKTVEEVEKYSLAFWLKWNLIDNGQKFVERIEKGEE